MEPRGGPEWSHELHLCTFRLVPKHVSKTLTIAEEDFSDRQISPLVQLLYHNNKALLPWHVIRCLIWFFDDSFLIKTIHQGWRWWNKVLWVNQIYYSTIKHCTISDFCDLLELHVKSIPKCKGRIFSNFWKDDLLLRLKPFTLRKDFDRKTASRWF